MESKKCTIRSKSSTSLLKTQKILFEITPGCFTPSSLKKQKPAENSKPTRNSSEHPPKLLRSPPSSSKYIPSFQRSQSKTQIRTKPKKKLSIRTSNNSPPIRVLVSQKSKKTPTKNLVIKLKESAPRLPIPNFIQKIASKSLTGSTNNKPKLNNQDNFFIQDTFAGVPSTLLCVLDGHGMFGHQISDFVKKTLPQELEKVFPLEGNTQIVTCPNLPVSVLSELRNSFSSAFHSVQTLLTSRKQVDATFSGTTANLVYIHGKTLVCANAGDSRAVLGRLNGDWEAFDLSTDHKPNEETEKKRIERLGGRVEPFKDSFGRFVGPDRVWLKHEPLPGLAMSRSIGDLLASTVGVSCEPDVLIHTLGQGDKFLVMGTDGLWEFVSSLECVRIVAQFYEMGSVEKAAEEACRLAVERWKRNEKCVDDITVIVVFLSVCNR